MPDYCPKMALISFHSQNMVGQDVLSNKVVVFMSLFMVFMFFMVFNLFFSF